MILALTLVIPAVAPAQTGFEYSQAFIDGLVEPMDIAFAGSSAVVADQCGVIHGFTPDGARTEVADIASRVRCDQPLTGLIGVAVTRNYTGDGSLFVYYTSDDGIRQEVARYPLTGTGASLAADIDAGAIILPDLPWAISNARNSGAVAVSADNQHLFVGVGENSSSQGHLAQDVSRTHGKILRVTFSGGSPGDNPMIGGKSGGDDGKIYALGLGRPFRIGVDALTNALWIGDTPRLKWSEVNRAQGGENFGWPEFEGVGHAGPGGATATDPVDPVLEYEDYVGPQSLVIVGQPYRPAPGAQFALPENFHGTVPVADFYASWLRLVGPGGEELRTEPGIASPRAIATGPDGAFYVVEASKKAVARLTWGDSVPVVTITKPAEGARFSAGDTLTLEGTAQDPEDGTITTGFEWLVTLTDGEGETLDTTPLTGTPATYTVPATADLMSQLTIQLRVRDSVGSTGTATRTLLAEATRVTFNTEPEGIEYTVDGEAQTGEVVRVWPAGLPIEVACPDEIVFEGALLVFNGWTDGGEPAHTFVVPDADTDMICRYRDFNAPPDEDTGPVDNPEFTPPGQAEPPPAGDDDGCQAAPRSHAPLGTWLLLLAGALTAIAGRRTRRSGPRA